MEFFKRLQSQPPYLRQLIFWSVIIIVAVALGFWWFKSVQQRLSALRGKEFIKNIQIPDVELPEIEFNVNEFSKTGTSTLEQENNETP